MEPLWHRSPPEKFRPFKVNPPKNPPNTLDPQKGYGYMEGLQNTTCTLTLAYPTRDNHYQRGTTSRWWL